MFFGDAGLKHQIWRAILKNEDNFSLTCFKDEGSSMHAWQNYNWHNFFIYITFFTHTIFL